MQGGIRTRVRTLHPAWPRHPALTVVRGRVVGGRHHHTPGAALRVCSVGAQARFPSLARRRARTHCSSRQPLAPPVPAHPHQLLHRRGHKGRGHQLAEQPGGHAPARAGRRHDESKLAGAVAPVVANGQPALAQALWLLLLQVAQQALRRGGWGGRRWLNKVGWGLGRPPPRHSACSSSPSGPESSAAPSRCSSYCNLRP